MSMMSVSKECISTLSSAMVVSVMILTTTTTVLGQQQQQQKTNFDIVPGTLVYFNSGTSKTGDPGTFFEKSNSYVEIQPSFVNEDARKNTNDHHDHARHYNKGNLRRVHIRKRKFQLENEKNARRQGQQCPGVCRYIPDRDFCPTTVIPQPEELEANDYDEDYYSEEHANSEEDYYVDEEEYDEDYNEVEPRRRLTEPRTGNGTSLVGKANNGGLGDNLYVVYPPLTRFAAAQGFLQNNRTRKDEPKKRNKVSNTEGKNRVPARRRRRRQRRPTNQQQVKLRPSALEQEILIRWDRVVERGPFIGGDIIVPEGVLLRPPNFRYSRKQWPDGEIPFTMDESLNSCRQSAIFDAMDEIEEKTCIRFVDRENDRNYIDIRRAHIGCSSYVGMIGGAQHLNLSTGCFSKFTVTHELMHAIGFDHEQSRKDRDKFIDIDFDNVLNEKEGQFELNPSFSGGGFPYDMRSIMHYSAFLFAKDKCEPTIYPVNEKVDICELGMGNGRGGMTDCDAAKINKMYKCTGKKYPKKCKVRK